MFFPLERSRLFMIPATWSMSPTFIAIQIVHDTGHIIDAALLYIVLGDDVGNLHPVFDSILADLMTAGEGRPPSW